MTTLDMKGLARRGAEARIADLNEELAAIYAAFPDLRTGRGKRPSSAVASATPTSARRKRRKMTAAQRKAVGERMKKYWASKKKTAK